MGVERTVVIGRVECTFAAMAMHRDTRSPLLSILVVIIPNLHLSTKVFKSSMDSFKGASLAFFAL